MKQLSQKKMYENIFLRQLGNIDLVATIQVKKQNVHKCLRQLKKVKRLHELRKKTKFMANLERENKSLYEVCKDYELAQKLGRK
mgnify:FL=1